MHYMKENFFIPERALVWKGTNNIISNDWDDLWDGAINMSLNAASNGSYSSGSHWTGTTTLGVEDGASNCAGWGQSSSGQNGIVGSPNATDSWINSGTNTCDNELQILCISWNGLTLNSIGPSNGQLGVPKNTTIRITFNRAMNVSTLSTNTLDTECSGSFQVSADEFETCIQMTGSPSSSDADKTFTVTPSSDLSGNTLYKIRVTTDAEDSNGTAMEQLTTSNGFTTVM